MRATERANEFFKTLLLNHYLAVTDPDVDPQPTDADGLIQLAFTQSRAFEELVRAAEGVPRDAINILSLAAQRALDQKISVPDVRLASKNWYQRDKEQAVRDIPGAQELLHWITDEVIGNRNARAVLLRRDRSSPLIEDLYDARVLHILKRNISSRAEPGVRYHAIKLDYGCYVDLASTSRAPTAVLPGMGEDTLGDFFSVPQDDYRSIRHLILDLEEFEASTRPQQDGE